MKLTTNKKMKFEKIDDSKFEIFSGTKIAYPHAVYGGYKGETSTGSTSDQIKSGSGSGAKLDHTDNPSGKANDGFK